MAIPRNLANIAPHVNASSTEVVVNDGGANLDFRVEGDTNANLLFVDAGNESVGIGTDSALGRLDTESGSYRQGFVFTSTNAPYSGLGWSANWDAYTNNGGAGPREYMGGITISAYAASTGANTGTIHFGTAIGGTKAERARISKDGYFKASDTGSYQNGAAGTHEFDQSANAVGFQVYATNASYTNEAVQILVSRNTTNNTFYAINYYNLGAGAYKFRVADSGNVTNTNNSYGSISDVKLKQDIVDAGSQWDDIKGLRVRKYRWKSDPDGFMQMGLVAQEAELVSPGLIDEHPDYEEVEVPVLDDEGNAVLNEDGTPQVTTERNALGTTTKSVKYSVLYMKAVKALQEAMERIETLEAKVAALESQS